MFWRFGGFANISTLDTILEKPDVTVEELLDESDLIQELKQQNSKLVEFLRNEPVLKKLLSFVTADKLLDPDEYKTRTDEKTGDDKASGTALSFFGKGKDRSRSKSVSKSAADGETELEKQEAQRKKYAYVSCEVLSSEVWSITEAVLEHSDHLREFWQYIYRPAPLDPLQAGYFGKVNEALLDKKTEDMLLFFKSLDGVVPAMLKHVDCPMIMDLLLKIISLEKHEGGQQIVDWLQSQNLIPLLLGYLSPEHTSATQTSAGDFLKAIITISANATTQDQSVIGPNELTRQLVSEKCIKALIDVMLKGGNPLTVGVGIVIEVIRKNNSDYDSDNQTGPEPKTSDPIYLGTLLRQFANHVPLFMHLIRAPSAKRPDLKAAFGGKIEPLGFDRFKTCELMAELLHCSNMGLLNERGAEEEVGRRDEERERLKAEGKLAGPRTHTGREDSHEEFGSSVDSHGFHHAARPTDDDMDGKPDELRRLEVQNVSDEDGFEKVNAPSADDLPDEVNFDEFDEKIDQATRSETSTPEKSNDASSNEPPSPTRTEDVPKPLSPNKKALPHFDPPPTRAADSPNTTGVIDQISHLDVDEDTVMSEFGEEPTDAGKHTRVGAANSGGTPLITHADEDGPSEIERALARPEDKPAPLFARKEPAPDAEARPDAVADQQEDIDQSVATLQGHEAAPQDGERPPYDTELDGSPVVGDLLKIQFVEHQVVPTILDFFFRFPWNNFLHNVVYDVVQQVFNGTLDRGYNRTLAFDLFTPVTVKGGEAPTTIGLASGKDVTDRILDGQHTSDASQSKTGMRLGYMGHLTLIAEEVCKFGNRHPPDSLAEVVLDRVNRKEWAEYVDGTLAETREKDNAVLGGVRPENAISSRSMGMGGGFSSNTANALASAGIGSGISAADSLALSEGTVGQSFEINSGPMLGGFGDGDEDEEMEDEAMERRNTAFSDDEQVTPESASTSSTKDVGPSIPPPLNIPPSRARRTLAARLAQKHQSTEDDPDAADATALEVATLLPEEPRESAADMDLGPAAAERDLVDDSGLHITGLGGLRNVSKFSGLFSSSDDDDDDDDDDDSSADSSDVDEDGAGRDATLGRAEGDYEASSVAEQQQQQQPPGRWYRSKARRPSTTEAKERTLLDDDEDDERAAAAAGRDGGDGGEGPFADPEDLGSSDDDDDDVVEIHSRRAS